MTWDNTLESQIDLIKCLISENLFAADDFAFSYYVHPMRVQASGGVGEGFQLPNTVPHNRRVRRQK